jgi:hypothetical protein
MVDIARSRPPAKGTGPATKTNTYRGHSSNSRPREACTCETFGHCVACSDQRAEAWTYRRTRIRLARAAEEIARKRDAERVAAERSAAHRQLRIWGRPS